VFAEARSYFGPPAEGFERLTRHLAELKPTVVLVNYGAVESFEGEPGLPKFLEGLDKLLALLSKQGARIVLITPTRQEDLGRPLPDPTAHNADVRKYISALRGVCERTGYPLVNLYEEAGAKNAASAERYAEVPKTDNGLHYTPYGYWTLARLIDAQLHAEPEWQLTLAADGKAVSSAAVKASDVKPVDGGLQFTLLDERLPRPAAPQYPAGGHVLHVRGLPVGTYALRVDEQIIATASAAEWSAGVRLADGPEFAQAEALRRKIVAKNQFFFHRWRPQNETYLFGFRKHEQGVNAKEIPQFDPLIAAAEQDIAKLRKPLSHEYRLLKVNQ
jgi:hypothetical protein